MKRVLPSFLACSIVAALACRHTSVDVPTMELSTEEPPEANVEIPASYVSAPIVLDLRPLIQEVEETVPTTFGSIDKDKRIQVSKKPKAWLSPEIRRGKLNFTFKDNEVEVSTVLDYRAKVWVKPLLIEHSVSCGMDKERPRIRLTIATKYDLAENWHLRTTSRVVTLEAMSQEERDQCKVTFISFDATAKVVEGARSALTGMLKKADERLAKVSIQKPITGIWFKLQAPISIAKGTLYLQIQPKSIALGPVKAQDSNLVARLDLLAAPRLVSGVKPANDSLPLPPLGRTTSATDVAVVQIEGVLAYAAANDLLAKALVGKKFGKWWARVKVEGIKVLAAGRGKIILGITLSGRVDGTIYAIGTPAFDPATDLITIPDLAFDVNTTGSLQGVAAWLVNGPFQENLRQVVKIPAAELLENVVTIANKELNRELEKGVLLRGHLDTASARTVLAAQRGFVARANATGKLWLEISKDNWIPDRKAEKPKASQKPKSEPKPTS